MWNLPIVGSHSQIVRITWSWVMAAPFRPGKHSLIHHAPHRFLLPFHLSLRPSQSQFMFTWVYNFFYNKKFPCNHAFIKRRKIHDRKGPLFLTDGSHHSWPLWAFVFVSPDSHNAKRKRELNGLTSERVIWQAVGRAGQTGHFPNHSLIYYTQKGWGDTKLWNF